MCCCSAACYLRLGRLQLEEMRSEEDASCIISSHLLLAANSRVRSGPSSISEGRAGHARGHVLVATVFLNKFARQPVPVWNWNIKVSQRVEQLNPVPKWSVAERTYCWCINKGY